MGFHTHHFPRLLEESGYRDLNSENTYKWSEEARQKTMNEHVVDSAASHSWRKLLQMAATKHYRPHMHGHAVPKGRFEPYPEPYRVDE